MKKLWATLLGCAALGSANAQDIAPIHDISYLWAEIRVETFDQDEGGDLDGIGGEFNFRLAPSWYIPASFLSGDINDNIGGNSNVTLWDVGLGWHRQVARNGDFIAELKYVDLDFDNGVELLGGFRHQLSDPIESKITLSVTDVDETLVTLRGGLLFEIWNEFGLNIDAQVDDESNWGAAAGLRWSF